MCFIIVTVNSYKHSYVTFGMEIPHNKLIVKQIKEMVEIFTGFETRNKYEVLMENGAMVFSYAFEESSTASLLIGGRSIMKIKIMDRNKKIYASIERPFGFFVSKIKIFNEEGRVIADAKQKFTFLSRKVKIKTPNSGSIECVARAPHLWTFNFLQRNREIARITKKWSGAKELISDADNFVVDFMNVSDNTLKIVILAMAFALDIMYFEH